jgi:hypothetical protein
MKFLKRLYLKHHGWEQAWHKDNWLEKDKNYSNPDWAGLDTEQAYKKARQKINKS